MAAATPQNTKQPKLKWTASEYIDHRQGIVWYMGLALMTGVLAVVAYFILDYFAVGTVVALGLILGVFAARTPEKLDYEISDKGISVGEKFHPYTEFKSFSLVRDGAVTSLNFYPIKRFMPALTVFFDPNEEQNIVGLLGEHLPHEDRPRDHIESLSRRLRF